MAKERSWNDFPQPNQANVIEPETRSASARYDLEDVQRASIPGLAVSEVPEQPLEGTHSCCTQLISIQYRADTYCAIIKDDKGCK